ncbi:hypothetical protein [Nostoc sp. CHAB 5715]|uniref:hypothetical protein n=1 Tax=Nostoc sp. CHAB 5715 TaxID=2780400 RepID=UPI001E2D9C8B|nr:hypothetical protein [Nostoc sp. CHAB 5715]MCC5623452.1 hypothetical protein [Nostoc sp. CHAB 5715]
MVKRQRQQAHSVTDSQQEQIDPTTFAERGLKERLVVDTSEGQPVYLLVSKSGSYIRLSPIAYQLLVQRSSGVSFATLAEILSQQMGRSVSLATVEAAYQNVVERIAKIEHSANHTPSGFLLRCCFLPKATVNRIASYLSVVFQPVIACCLLTGVILATAIAPQHDLSLNVTPTVFWCGYVLFLVSLLIHELGHASACVRYGAKAGEIGGTIYLIFPAFYSDVSAAWELLRWQRVIVDLGGIFFQLVVAALYVIVYKLSGWEPFKVALILIASSCLFMLNPVFKSDGYWVIADAMGVTNLGQQPLRIFHHFIARLRHQPVQSLPWSMLVTATLVLYTLLSFSIWGYFLWAVLPMLWRQVLGYPSLAIALINDFLNSPQRLNIKHLQSFLGSTFNVLVALLIVLNLTRVLVLKCCGKDFWGIRRLVVSLKQQIQKFWK